MTSPAALPKPIYEWPAGDVGAAWGQVLRQIAITLRTRRDHPKHPPVTCWTTQLISAEEYNMLRHDGDQQRKASRPGLPENLSNPESAPARPTPQSSQERSRSMQATHHQMRIGLVAVMLVGWECLIYNHQAGIHMALDVIDNVRVKITSP